MSKKKQKSTDLNKTISEIQKSENDKFVENTIIESPEIQYDFELIRFDKKLNVFLGICVCMFLVLSLLKIQGSSAAIWNERIPIGASSTKNILKGKAKSIRMDEYAVQTPFTLSQVYNDFSTVNPAIGGENAPLTAFLPVKHYITYFRPNFWGYFFLSTEQAFAWAWNFKTFGILIAITLMLLLLTKNNFPLSVFGSFWLLYSSGTQWWFSTALPDSIFTAAILFICTVYLIFSKSTVALVISSVCFIIFGIYYASMLYPPYQLPLAYFIVFLLIGYIIQHYDKAIIFQKVYLKIGLAIFSLVALGFIMFTFYTDAKHTIETLRNTVYPGKRTDYGGAGFTANMFSEYYHRFITDEKFPQTWVNICELSHYINFLPVIIISTVWYYYNTKKLNFLIIVPSVFLIFLLIWIKIGFPEGFAKLTLMSMSPPRRTQIPFGVASVILALTYLGQTQTFKTKKTAFLEIAISIGIIIAFMVLTAIKTDETSQQFFKTSQLVTGVILFALANIFLLYQIKFKYRDYAFMGIVGISLIPNFMINPITKGLSPITEHSIHKHIREINKTDPGKRWMVMGNQFYGYMAQTAGVNVLGGVKYVPDFKTMAVLDGHKRDTVYNRYAHTVYYSYIDNKDTTVIGNSYEDAYGIGLDGCSPRLKKLNVKYVVFEKQPQPVEVRCMTKIVDEGFQIYKIND